MRTPNWRESSPELKAAWFEFKKNYTGAGRPCLSSFAAGWNIQKEKQRSQLRTLAEAMMEAHTGMGCVEWNGWRCICQACQLAREIMEVGK